MTAAHESTEDWRGSEATLRVSRRGRVRVTLALARSRQWIKNLLVIAAAGAAGILGRDDVLGRVLVATAAFCLERLRNSDVQCYLAVLKDLGDESLYPRLERWRAVRDRADPERRWCSDLALRAALVPR